jgi:hypothetical protein
MPNDEKGQPDPDLERERRDRERREREAGDDAIEEEVRRNAERHGGIDDEGRPVKPSAPEVEPDLSEDEAKIAEERGELGRSPGQKD